MKPLLALILMTACIRGPHSGIRIIETSESGHRLTELSEFPASARTVDITLHTEQRFQTITGFGGSFTEASASLLNRMSPEKRKLIIDAYFADSGARYSLTRTHINSSDFSLGNYSFAPVPGDTALLHFSIDEDRDDILPMIKDAMAASSEGFKIIASPWTAPPWMKDNNDWRGGKLLPQYYPTWARFFAKYLDAYRAEGIPIWGLTVENEPLGNDSNWESMHFTPWEMNDFVKGHLGPVLRNGGYDVKLLGFDQNRDEQLKIWVDAMFDDPDAAQYFDGTAVHWYASTVEYFPEALEYAHRKAPGKHLIHTEGTIDAEVPKWKDDAWYWSAEATDWGWDWAPAHQKHLHPKYVPVFRYARDIIGSLNHHVDGWIDWNMVLDRQGGPNWAKNWCVAPVIVDPETDEVYFTPLYHTMAHFSTFIRPGAVRIGFTNPDETLMSTAARNPDGSIAVVLFNPTDEVVGIRLHHKGKPLEFSIRGKAIQTVLIPN
ncbi:MAG: glucosylceramidase [Bacteroidota bacterium]|jgi:glucosylceramidase